ncbi:hypothetical protein EBU94_03210 [bacterium]|nr:hypothetical protein [bacterium]
MKNFILETDERKRIINLYQSKGLILNEQLGALIRKAISWAGKNEDDIATLFKTSEKALAVTIDDIVSAAVKSKSVTQLDDLQIKLMHAFNPSGQVPNMVNAQAQVKNILNGYAKSKGQSNWTQIKNSVTSPTQSAGQSAGASASSAAAASANKLAGQRVSNRWYGWTPDNIDFTQMSNIKNIDELNKAIANALKSGNLNLIPRGGFDKLGIKSTDFGGYGFRGFMKDQMINKGAKINEIIPEQGRWSVTFV